MNVGDWIPSHVGASPFWVKWRMSHVSAPAMEDRSCVGITTLYGPACVGAAIVNDGSPESSAILELGEVVG